MSIYDRTGEFECEAIGHVARNSLSSKVRICKHLNYNLIVLGVYIYIYIHVHMRQNEVGKY